MRSSWYAFVSARAVSPITMACSLYLHQPPQKHMVKYQPKQSRAQYLLKYGDGGGVRLSSKPHTPLPLPTTPYHTRTTPGPQNTHTYIGTPKQACTGQSQCRKAGGAAVRRTYSIVNSPLPCVADRRSVEKPNIWDRGTSACTIQYRSLVSEPCTTRVRW